MNRTALGSHIGNTMNKNRKYNMRLHLCFVVKSANWFVKNTFILAFILHPSLHYILTVPVFCSLCLFEVALHVLDLFLQIVNVTGELLAFVQHFGNLGCLCLQLLHFIGSVQIGYDD